MVERRIADSFKNGKITFADYVKKKFGNSYGLVGNHSGVQICSWTRKALRGKGICYKQKFYGIDCHRCCQMSPALAWCQENCIFCWRPMEWMKKIEMGEDEVDAALEIIEGSVTARRKLISGVGGADDANQKMWRESFDKFPSHWAISLSGEPTIYPKLGELIELLTKHSEVKSVFLVTNGQEPKALLLLAERKQLPTQLYVSVDAANEEMFKKVNKSLHKNGWKRLNETLELLPKLRCRRVLRFTLIKGLNDDEKLMPEYAALFEKSEADFIEVKGYMFLGESRRRLKFDNMPTHEYIVDWSKKFAKQLSNYKMINEDRLSRITLFKRKDSPYENIIRRSVK
jgi:tRNA wybutosine-synthesizing protein 1